MFRTLKSWLRTARTNRPAARTRLGLEAMETRDVPAAFTVTNPADAGPGSLRSAVDAANANPGADRITFATPFGNTIVLTSGDLDITDAVSTDGPGWTQLRISGNGTSRIFDIARGAGDVRIAGLELREGKADDGGAIRAAGGTRLTVESCFLGQNAATGRGGAIATSTGDLVVKGCFINHNEAAGVGGGIAVGGGRASVIGTDLVGNRARGGGGLDAGRNSDVTVQHSTISGNTASANGGGIRLSRGTLAVSDSFVTGNTAGHSGGGIYAVAGTDTGSGQDHFDATVRGGGVVNNTAAVGSNINAVHRLSGASSTLHLLDSTTGTVDSVVWSGAVDVDFDGTIFSGGR